MPDGPLYPWWLNDREDIRWMKNIYRTIHGTASAMLANKPYDQEIMWAVVKDIMQLAELALDVERGQPKERK